MNDSRSHGMGSADSVYFIHICGSIMTDDKRPILGISSGDPAGIGPEICCKALSLPEVYDTCRPVLVSDAGVIRDAMKIAGVPLEIHTVDDPLDGTFTVGTLDLIDLKNVNMNELEYGSVSAMCGKASFEYVTRVIQMAQDGRIKGTVTGPIHKEALNLAGCNYPGHTEIFAEMTKTRDFAMTLMDGNLRVAHVSTHCSLRDACDRIRRDRIVRVISILHNALMRLGIPRPRIAVAGLNPHAGEGGLFGTEETEEIIPAIEEAAESGMDVTGPLPPDTIFPKLLAGLFDGLVAMYHDQGHIALKFHSFRYMRESDEWSNVSGVNITLGLPIIRTSVDHGTAFDRAGKGISNPQSLVQAITLAAKLAYQGDEN